MFRIGSTVVDAVSPVEAVRGRTVFLSFVSLLSAQPGRPLIRSECARVVALRFGLGAKMLSRSLVLGYDDTRFRVAGGDEPPAT